MASSGSSTGRVQGEELFVSLLHSLAFICFAKKKEWDGVEGNE